MHGDAPTGESAQPEARWLRFARERGERLRLGRQWQVLARSIQARFELPRHSSEAVEHRLDQLHDGEKTSARDLAALNASEPSEHGLATRPDGEDAPERAGRAKQPLSPLDPHLQAHIEGFLRVPLPKIHVHSSAAADRMARRVGADAVTQGNVIHFRDGAFQPSSPAGLALLVHEATHVAWVQGARPLAHAAREEQVATENERRYLTRMDSLALRPPSLPPAAAAPAPGMLAAPFAKTALASRDLAESGETAESGASGALPQAAVLSSQILKVLKADLYRTLLDKLRSDFERGG